jgi:hypothetical protein
LNSNDHLGNATSRLGLGAGLSPDEYSTIRSRTPVYLTADLFYEYISAMFVSYVTGVQNNPALANEPAILVMHSAPPHGTGHVLRLLGEKQAIALVFPTLTTNLCQAFDLAFFGALKQLKQMASGD